MKNAYSQNRRLTVAGVAQGLLCGMLGSAVAQTSPWPNRPIKWIVSQAAGSGPDIVARYIAESLSKALGQTVVIDNRPGGQNVIGALAAARAAPDGYTFFYGTTAAMVTNSFTFKSLPYDPEKDFVPVALIARTPFIIAASQPSGIKTLQEAISQAKVSPEKLAIATEGPRTFSGMLADMLASMAGVKFTHVPYTKASDAIQDVLGGRVALICLPDAALASAIKSGQLNALAVSTAQRVANMPGVPALSSTFRDFEYTGWNGLFAPTGTPVDITERLNRELALLLAQSEVMQRLQSLGSIAEGTVNPLALNELMKSERQRWARLVKAIGLVAE